MIPHANPFCSGLIRISQKNSLESAEYCSLYEIQ